MENIDISGASGSVSLLSTNTKINLDSSWKLNVKSSSVGLNIVQTTPIGGDVTIDAKTTGKRDVTLNFNGDAAVVRAKLTGNEDITIRKNEGFSVANSKTMESLNYNNTALDQFQISMSVDKGNIEVNAVTS